MGLFFDIFDETIKNYERPEYKNRKNIEKTIFNEFKNELTEENNNLFFENSSLKNELEFYRKIYNN
jgi:hypothetical protein